MLVSIVGDKIDAVVTGLCRITGLNRLPGMKNHVGLAVSTIYRCMSGGEFSKPVELDGYSLAWAENGVKTWTADRLI